jgi:hypothetical protein
MEYSQIDYIKKKGSVITLRLPVTTTDDEEECEG